MDREILFQTFKQKLHLPAAPVQVQDFFAAVFCARGCNNRNPSGAEQRFCLDPALVFQSFPGFTLPCFCCLSVREPVSDYPYKACFPLYLQKPKTSIHSICFSSASFIRAVREIFSLCASYRQKFFGVMRMRCPIPGIRQDKVPFFHRLMS